jgi:phage host-nuclease inhibitor protein Gam
MNVIMISYCTSRELSDAESLKQSMTEQLGELQREVTALEHQLAVERAAIEAEKRRTMLLQVHKKFFYVD